MKVEAAGPRPMRLWVTRPEEDASQLAAALDARGIQAVVHPLLRIEFLDGPPLELAGVQALLATSANGVRAFARRSVERALPLLAVGDATARVAEGDGFACVRSAAGDVAALAELATLALDPARGPLLHVAGSDLAGDLSGMLAAHGFHCRREVLYRARAADRLPADVAFELTAGRLDGLLLYSPRTARILMQLLRAGDLELCARRLDCWCLSSAVAAVVADAPWRRVITADRPTQAALLAAIDEDARARLSPGENSLSSRGHFIGSLDRSDAQSQFRDGGMTSESKTGLPAEGTAPAQDETRAATATATPEGEPEPTDREAPPEVLVADPADGGADAGSPPRTDSSASPLRETPTGGSSSRGLLLAGVVLLALIGAGAAAWRLGWIDFIGAPATAPEMADRATEVDAALDDLDGRVARLRQVTDALAPRLEGLERQVVMLRQSLDQLATQAGQGSREELEAVENRLGRLEGQAQLASGLAQQVRSLEATTAAARDTASKLATTVLAVGQLVQAVDDGGPFARQLAAVRAMGGDDGDIAQAAVTLEPLAGTGVPTLATLRAEFPVVADAVARATPVTAGDGWTDKVMEQLASLVSVRRVGPAAIAAGGVDGLLAQAQTALDAGNLRGAVDAVGSLSGPEAAPAHGWLARAQSRLAAEHALATLQQRALARLSAAKG